MLLHSPLRLSQLLQAVFLCFCGLPHFSFQLLLLAGDLLLLQHNLLSSLNHLNLHLLIFNALLGLGHLSSKAQKRKIPLLI